MKPLKNDFSEELEDLLKKHNKIAFFSISMGSTLQVSEDGKLLNQIHPYMSGTKEDVESMLLAYFVGAEDAADYFNMLTIVSKDIPDEIIIKKSFEENENQQDIGGPIEGSED